MLLIKRENVIGEKFGRLTVLEDAPDKTYKNGGRDRIEKCQCDCGNIVYVKLGKLKSGHTKSCGCYHDECCKQRATKHGLKNTRLYRIWSNMKSRCNNPNTDFFYIYGEKGIKVCSEWNDFEKFYLWAVENGYNDNLTIDRIDNSKGYYPDNCRWATFVEQANNKTNNHIIEYNNKKYTMKEFSDEFNILYGSIKSYLRKGKTANEIINTCRRSEYKNIQVNDMCMSLKEWSKYLNVNYNTLHNRIKYYGMTPEEAILKSIKEKENDR